MTYRILVVDDSPIIRAMVRRSLSMAGIDVDGVQEAENGLVAMEKLLAGPVDIVLTDINMPELDGIALVRRMSRRPDLASIPVVVVSTEGSENRLAELRRLGIRGYIRKPFRPEQFRAVMNEIYPATSGE